MKRVYVLCLAIETIALSQSQPVTGTISGVLTGEDGTVLSGASIALHLVTKSRSKIGQQTTDWRSVSNTAGMFQFGALPEGEYTVCPRVPNSTWLNPCDWSLPTPTATITRPGLTASINITLKRGAAVAIRINDTGQLMAQNEGKTPGAGLLLEVSDASPGSFFRLVPLVSQDSGGRNHQIVIPFNTPLTLFVDPTFYRVISGSGAPLGQHVTARIPLLVASGQQIAPIVFTITGHY